jgi:hypothetical protein
MIPDRKYKKIPETEILSLVSKISDDESDARLAAVFGDLPDKYFAKMIAEHRMFCTEISCNGESLYRMFWLFQCEGKNLHICAALQITNRQNFSALCDGAEKIARLNGCSKITFCTERSGLVEKSKSWGAIVTGVTMEKTL